MFKSGMRSLSLILAVVILVSIGSVCAGWHYADMLCNPRTEEIGLGMNIFNYPPEEVLPGGDMEEAELGGNHYGLVDLVLNENEKDYGLNISNNVVIHKYLQNQRVVYSNQKVSGGNLKFILDPQNNTHGLYYCVEKVSDTEYYCYTFSVDALATAGGTGSEIAAYRTTLLKTNKWNATVSYLGYAKVKSLRDLGESADPNAVAYSIDVDTWHA